MRELEASGLDISTEIQVHRGVEALPLLRGDLWSCPARGFGSAACRWGRSPVSRADHASKASPASAVHHPSPVRLDPALRSTADGWRGFALSATISTIHVGPAVRRHPPVPARLVQPGLSFLSRPRETATVRCAVARRRNREGAVGSRWFWSTKALRDGVDHGAWRAPPVTSPSAGCGRGRGAGWLGPGKLSAGGRGPPWRFRCTAGRARRPCSPAARSSAERPENGRRARSPAHPEHGIGPQARGIVAGRDRQHAEADHVGQRMGDQGRIARILPGTRPGAPPRRAGARPRAAPARPHPTTTSHRRHRPSRIAPPQVTARAAATEARPWRVACVKRIGSVSASRS